MRARQAKKTEREIWKIERQQKNEAAVTPVVQQEAIVDKRVIETGKVRISKKK